MSNLPVPICRTKTKLQIICRHPRGSECALNRVCRAYVLLGHLGLARRVPMLGQAATSFLNCHVNL